MFKFTTGKNVYITAGAQEIIEKNNIIELFKILEEHMKLDEKTCCPEDMIVNLNSLNNGGMILTTHYIADNKIWIISQIGFGRNKEKAAEETTILLPEEY